mgnify:FL=1|jgi:hypothetical protein
MLVVGMAVSLITFFLRREIMRTDMLARAMQSMQVDLAKNSEQNRQLFYQFETLKKDLREIQHKLDRLIESQANNG